MTRSSTLRRPLQGMTIGLIDDYSEAGLMPDVATAFSDCIAVLESCGAIIRRISLHGLDVAVDAQVIVDAAEPSAVHDAWLHARGPSYGPDVRAQLQAGLGFTAVEYLHAQRFRTYLREQVDRHFQDIDLILTPTLPFTAPLIGQHSIMIGDEEESTLTGNMRFTCLPSLTALPAISFPIGLDRSNLPIGAQLMAPAGEEMRLMRAVHQFEQVTAFHAQRPSLSQAVPSMTC
ncbi:amidase [Acidisoma silvae]|uniref:Amidase domain-containing protein n=1 Tax=Acidisoma silvae TaxID=2802396 RepID=A0A964E0A8_9PROT|nr:amidase family protein [Acidisoma silvae]MCB8876974.1 hypothetical protein [Acidisoma silvae]